MTLRPSTERNSNSDEKMYLHRLAKAESLHIRVTCPICGSAREGNTDDIMVWRDTHRCRRAVKVA